MTERTTYAVHAVPDGRWYSITIDDLPPGMVGVTQSPTDEGVEGVESMTREVIALLLQVDGDSFDLDIEIKEGESNG